MTYETRIGLLVGLVFIVMFGLVLSELMRTDIPATATAEAEAERPTELGSTIPPVAAPSAAGSRQPTARRAAPARTRREPVTLTAEARAEAPTPQPAAPRHASRPVVHTVGPGDTLTAIARRYYGPQHGDKHELIFRANRNVLADRSSLSVGQALVIPPLAGSPAPAPGQPHRQAASVDLGRGRRSAAARTCTVRPGDTLTRIAGRELGDSSHGAAMRIYNANRDRLSDPDRLTVGMELRIPQ